MFTNVVVLCLTFMVVSAGYCPKGWNNFGKKCYYFSDTVDTWYKNIEDCNVKGGHLLKIESQQENDYITLRLKGRQFDDFVFIDGTDELREGKWVWFSTQETLGFTNWLRLKPSRRDDENCIAICPSANEYKWSDVPCENKYRYICEKEMLIESPDKSGCLTVQSLLEIFRPQNGDGDRGPPGTDGNHSHYFREMAKRVSTLEWKMDHVIGYGNVSAQRLGHLEGTYQMFWQSLMTLNESIARLENKMKSNLQRVVNEVSRRITATNGRVMIIEGNWRNFTKEQRRMEIVQNGMENWLRQLNGSIMQNALEHSNFSRSIKDLYRQVDYIKDNYLIKTSTTRPPSTTIGTPPLTINFTSCGQTGNTVPTLSRCQSSYNNVWPRNKTNFNVISGVQKWTIPETTHYVIDAYGAGGGHGDLKPHVYGGGNGSRIRGTFYLNSSTVLNIVVGQRGMDGGSSEPGGGGGGTFVFIGRVGGSGLLIAAGGGGGAGEESTHSGYDGSDTNFALTRSGLVGSTISGNGGVGYGGVGGNFTSAGAGWYSNGGAHRGSALANPGRRWSGGASPSSGTGGGGFGGGGSGVDTNGGGGGGGYTGGPGISTNNRTYWGGSGGGSFNGGTNQMNITGFNSGDGKVIVTKL